MGMMRAGRGERRLGVALAAVLAALGAGGCTHPGGGNSGAGGSETASSGTSGGGGQDSVAGSGAGGPGQGGGGSGAGGAGGAGGAPDTLLWRKHISTVAANEEINDVAVDATGDVVIVGKFTDTVDFGGGALVCDSGTDVFVAKLDPAGNHLWSKSFGSAGGDTAESVAIDPMGDVIVTGWSSGPNDNFDAFVVKLDAAGNHVWSSWFGDADAQFGAQVAVDSAGTMIVAGTFRGSIDFGGGPLQRAPTSGDDIFVAALDPAGNHLWSKALHGNSLNVVHGLAVDVAGNIAMTGDLSGGGGPVASVEAYDIFVAVLDGAGGHVWSTRFGANGSQETGAVAVDGADNILLTGINDDGTIDLGGGPVTAPGEGKHLFVAKLSAAGSHLWSRYYHGTGWVEGRAIAADPAGNVFVAANFMHNLDIGGVMVSGSTDTVLGKWAA